MERRKAVKQIERLKEFAFTLPDRFLPLTTAHLESAAQLWGQARNAGLATASNEALDGDVILAAQVLSLGLSSSDYVVATSNVSHLARFVTTAEWQTIVP